MTIRFNPQGYKPTKKERITHNMDTFERKVGRALDHLNAGETTKDQFIHEINVAHGNYKRNQREIYNLED
ncbi:hypothetical protein CJ191_01255 [Aerococcus viridans]|uniref:Uncharacterized protein n=1 Tax=Aerococcus viridans TaxID=1377 RepID=A0A2N6UFX6_9LACT|nr:hypothetical protein [Aerococcus viridans]PMC80463.1 hypothetical protein CJ191_01255 [Aerococcus viridans]